MSAPQRPRLGLVFVALAIALAACSEPPPAQETVRPVITRLIAANADASAVAAYAGEVRARHENDLAFRIGGKVISRHVEIGSTVRRGQLLARLDPQDVQLQAESARAQVASAEAEVTWARADFERYAALHEKKFVSGTVLDQKRHALSTAEARVRQMQAQQAVLVNQSEYASLLADADGVITSLSLEPGQVVAAGQPVLRLARPQEKEVLISVPEGRIEELRTAAALQVTLWTKPDRRFSGRVREVAPNADATTRTFAVRVTIVGADAAVRLGMTANVLLPGDSGVKGWLVPLTAVGDQAGNPVVWVFDQASAVHPRAVTIGAWREDGAVVTSGLQGGERIVVVGVQKLREGQQVRRASDEEERVFAGAALLTAPGTASSPVRQR